ncbi:MAG: hypothetical protein PVJ09_03415 [Candidatus Woesebacteria bacterium]|jgi:hypothetical protein
MRNNSKTYKDIFINAIKNKEIQNVKLLLSKFEVPLNEQAIHNLAVSLVSNPSGLEVGTSHYHNLIQGSLQKMQQAEFLEASEEE